MLCDLYITRTYIYTHIHKFTEKKGNVHLAPRLVHYREGDGVDHTDADAALGVGHLWGGVWRDVYYIYVCVDMCVGVSD